MSSVSPIQYMHPPAVGIGDMYSNSFQGLAGGYMHGALGASSAWRCSHGSAADGDCATLHKRPGMVVHAINRYTPAITAGRQVVVVVVAQENGDLARWGPNTQTSSVITAPSVITEHTCKGDTRKKTRIRKSGLNTNCIISTANL